MRRVKIPCPFAVEFEEVPEPESPPADGVVARAVCTGISAGTERMWYDGSNPAIVSGRRGYPYYPGYEFVGQLTVVGDEVTNAGVGDYVFAMAPHAEYVMLTAESYWTPLPHNIAPEAALVIALAATGLHSAHRANLRVGDTVAVVGLGVVGIVTMQVAKAAGAGLVLGITRSPRKRELAEDLGADQTFDPHDPDLVQKVLALTNGRGVDIAIECAGVGEAVATATAIVRSQGRVIIEGFHTQPFPVSGEDLFSKELTIAGVRSAGSHEVSEFNRWNRRANFQLACDLVFSGKVNGARLATHRFLFHEIEQAYQLITKGQEYYLQIVLEWDNTEHVPLY